MIAHPCGPSLAILLFKIWLTTKTLLGKFETPIQNRTLYYTLALSLQLLSQLVRSCLPRISFLVTR